MCSNLYFDIETEKLFKDGEWCKSHYSDRTLSSRVVKNGIALTAVSAKNRFGLDDIEVGVFDEQGNYVEQTGMTQSPFKDLSIPKDVPYIDKKVIWGGFLYFHYGHFLLQGTTRMYEYFRQERKYPIVFSVFNKKLPKFIKDFFRLCEIPDEDIILINEHTRFKEIICPDISSQYYKDYTNEFRTPFIHVSKNVKPAKYKKIFFSRKHWKGMAKCFGEEVLEKVFNKNGFHSVEMEKLSLKEQIAIIKGAEVLAGINGTAFHNILFDSLPKTLIMLNRNEEYDSQYIINEATKANCYVIKAYSNPIPVSHPNGPFIVGLTDYAIEFFKDYGIKTFGYSFNPENYLKSFIKMYYENYSQPNLYKELECRSKDSIKAQDLINILPFIYSENPKRRFFYYLFSKIFLGKIRRYFKQKYQKVVKLKEEFKY